MCGFSVSKTSSNGKLQSTVDHAFHRGNIDTHTYKRIIEEIAKVTDLFYILVINYCASLPKKTIPLFFLRVRLFNVYNVEKSTL